MRKIWDLVDFGGKSSSIMKYFLPFRWLERFFIVLWLEKFWCDFVNLKENLRFCEFSMKKFAISWIFDEKICNFVNFLKKNLQFWEFSSKVGVLWIFEENLKILWNSEKNYQSREFVKKSSFCKSKKFCAISKKKHKLFINYELFCSPFRQLPSFFLLIS